MKRALVFVGLAALTAACGGDDTSNQNYPAFPPLTKTPDAAPVDLPIDGGPPVQQLRINEVSIADVGGDDEEFVELFGEPDTNYDTFSIIIIEGDEGSTAAGVIDYAISVGTTDSDGFWSTSLPSNDDFENQSQTVLLVRTLDGGVVVGTTDIDDAGSGAETPDDGVPNDTVPWAATFDAVGINDGNTADFAYLTFGGLTYGPEIELNIGGGNDGGVARFPDGFDTNAATDFKIVPEDGDAGTDDTLANRTYDVANTIGIP